MSDILIKGMEMPSSCWECHFGHGDTGVCVVDFKNHGDWDEPHDCPLVPVPKHGRLIDADALMEESGLSTSPDSCEGCQHKNGNRCDGYEWAMLCEALSDAPTIVPAEEGET